MTEESFETAYILQQHIRKLEAIKAKIKREFPEFEYDTESKEIGDMLYKVIDESINLKREYFKSL